MDGVINLKIEENENEDLDADLVLLRTSDEA